MLNKREGREGGGGENEGRGYPFERKTPPSSPSPLRLSSVQVGSLKVATLVDFEGRSTSENINGKAILF